MNAEATLPAGSDPAHPSPHRGKVSLIALWTGLLLAPLAWLAQLTIETPLLSQACYPRDEPHQGPLPGLLHLVSLVDALTLVVVIAGFVVAWLSWRRTAGERPGDGHRLMSSGDGRSRFMAMMGMLGSGIVAMAVVYIAGVHLILRGCGL